MKQYTTTPAVRHRTEIAQAMAQHEGLVHWVVHRQWLGDLSYTEALQAGRMGLWRALQGYDPHRGTAFSTYAVPAIARAIWRAVAQAQPAPQEFLTPYPPQEASDPEEEAEQALIRQALHQLVHRLPPRLHYIITARYGLHGHPAHTFVAIGRALGLTPERVRQLHHEALLWLGHPAHSLTLRSLLDKNSVADYQSYLADLRRWLRARRGIR